MIQGTLKTLATTAGAGAAATALAGLANSVIGRRPAPLGPAIDAPFDEYDWDGGRVGYYHAGEGPAVVLLHSHNAAGSAWEMRALFALLADRFEVYAPDLPGYGRSERRAREYQDHTYIRFLHDFLNDVVGRPAAVVASSVTAAQALVAIAEDPDAFTHLVCISPTGLRKGGGLPPGIVRVLGEAARLPVWGQTLFSAIASRAYIRRTLERSIYHDRTKVTDGEVAYSWMSAHQPNARYAPASFLAGDLWPDAHAAYAGVRRPLMLVWGEHDVFNAIGNSEEGIALNPRARVETVRGCGATPHTEQPAALAALLFDFLSGSAS